MTSGTPATTPATVEAKTPSRGRPRDEERSAAILAAARDLLHRSGWDSFRMNDVAKAAGCGLATIYRRWDNKEALVAAAINARPLPEFDPTGDAEADLRAILAGFAAEMQEMGESMFGFFAATRTDPALRQAMDESMMGTARDGVRELVVELMDESGHVDTVVDAAFGLLIMRLGLQGGTSPQEYADDVLGLIHALAGST